eukprot:Gregarina_sp_Pseudo_9__3416@NODE_358_length_3066_cov_30_221672_g337_i0_p1_GENE_NODE_358_length_3066_cov_30_221672_g337_i0NODE_358_length_3066_cov_30_221672_g337_i0_p1_ORF_typecomplete_len808_score226_76zf_CCCH_4/PF18345_1/1_2e03zf_CCCH_4/PF18345_1/0_00046zf_CCCH_4/PF18345_1/8_6e02zfCCCH/PF00642_24/4_8zfCCCH/PF00642_24/0_15zfCCCH/PF00642_24/3_1e02_NODE_358_length_3066_cov_30_221672_g337_i01722595
MPNANHQSPGVSQSSRSRNRRHHGNNSNVDTRKSNSRHTPFYSSPSLGSELNLVSQHQQLEGSSTPSAASPMNVAGGFFDSSFTRGSRAPPGGLNFPLKEGRNLVGSSNVGGYRSPTSSPTGMVPSASGPSWFPPSGIMPELAAPHIARQHPMSRTHRERRLHCNRHPSYAKGGSLVPSPPPACLNLICSVAGDSLLFSETNMDWTKLNIFRTRLCDRLTQTHTCHMANRCLFSHDVNWPRRTPFLPRATALTLRYIPVWCPRLSWPPLLGYCDSSGKISWTSSDCDWDARNCHQRCTRGDNCPFVHNVEEFLYHPEVYKTRSCCLANDDNFEEQMNSNCVALCPWYFCPFAHDVYELRDLRASKFAWHPPPQIVDNQFVARTQDFNELELRIIEFVRKSPSGSLDLYSSAQSPLRQMAKLHMPPVIRPISGSSLETLTPSIGHREGSYDDLLYTMVTASFLNLLLYPVENFYVPTLLSLQCAVLQSQLQLPGALNCAELLQRFDLAAGGSSPTTAASTLGGSGFLPAKAAGEDESPRLRPSEERASPRAKQPPLLPLANLDALDQSPPSLSFRQAYKQEPSSGRSARNSPGFRYGFVGRRNTPTQTPTSRALHETPKSPSSRRRANHRASAVSVSSFTDSWKDVAKLASPRSGEHSTPHSAKKTDLPRSSASLDCGELLLGLDTDSSAGASPAVSPQDLFAASPAGGATNSTAATDADAAGLKAILDVFKPEELLQMMTLLQHSQPETETAWTPSPSDDFAEAASFTPPQTPAAYAQPPNSHRSSVDMATASKVLEATDLEITNNA